MCRGRIPGSGPLFFFFFYFYFFFFFQVPSLFPAASASPLRSPPHSHSPLLISGVASLSPIFAPVSPVLVGSRDSGGEGTLLLAPGTPWSQQSEEWEGETGPRRPCLPPPLFTRRLPPRKLNPPAVILFGNFGQLP